jgi:2-C-methyl-D-erythritol 4-phosphate cytidylyltransferase
MRKAGRVRVAVVIPAGGSGTRMGGRLPKQFLKIQGEPILLATVRRFVAHPAIDLVVVAAPASHLTRTRRLLRPLCGQTTLSVVEGGAERQESVWRGLQAIPDAAAIVLVHDAVRPFVTRELIDDVLRATAETGAAICARPVAETVKRVVDGSVKGTLDRRNLWLVQTPQGFKTDLLREAHDRARRDGVVGTDDAMLVERLRRPVRVVLGIAENVKITTPEDLRVARTHLPRGPSTTRTPRRSVGRMAYRPARPGARRAPAAEAPAR